MKRRLLFVVNVDWFFVSHRLAIAQAALRAGYEVHLAARFTGHEERLRGEGFILHPLPIERGAGGPVALIREFAAILRVMRSIQADVVHLVTIKPVLAGGLAARLTRTGGVLVAISGLGTVFLAEGRRARLRRFLVKKLYRLALSHRNLRIVVQNRDDFQILQDMTRLPSAAITLIPGSGVDTEVFHPGVSVDPERLVVMLAGRLLKDKGVCEFAEAARLLQSDRDVASAKPRFVLVGSPDPDNPTSIDAETLHGWKDAGLLEFWGNRNDMAETLRAADIVVLPSYREGLPKVLQEAAACGKPVVTSDVPGCRDAIVPDRTGLLVRVRDSHSLANGIKQLLVDERARRKMGEEGRKLALDRFRIEVVFERHLSLYAELIAGSRPPA